MSKVTKERIIQSIKTLNRLKGREAEMVEPIKKRLKEELGAWEMREHNRAQN